MVAIRMKKKKDGNFSTLHFIVWIKMWSKNIAIMPNLVRVEKSISKKQLLIE